MLQRMRWFREMMDLCIIAVGFVFYPCQPMLMMRVDLREVSTDRMMGQWPTEHGYASTMVFANGSYRFRSVSYYYAVRLSMTLMLMGRR